MLYIHLPSQQVFDAQEIVSISEREIQALRHISRGMTQLSTSREMGYAWYSTLRQQLQKMRLRFAVETVAELVALLSDLGILRVRATNGAQNRVRQPVGRDAEINGGVQ